MNEPIDDKKTEDKKVDTASTPEIVLPENTLIILPVRNVTLFPGIMLPITIGRIPSVNAAQEAVRSERPIGVITQRDSTVNDPGIDDLYRIGTEASIVRFINDASGNNHIICQGHRRFRIKEFVEGYPFFLAHVDYLESEEKHTPEMEAHVEHLRRQAREAVQLIPQIPADLVYSMESVESGSNLADMVAGFMDLNSGEKQEILETLDVQKRIEKVSEFLGHKLEVIRLSGEIEKQTKDVFDKRQRDFVLREQMKTIQKELGEDKNGGEEIKQLQEKIEAAGMPEEARKEADKELKRLERTSESSSEYSMIRTYLDTLIELPWNKLSEKEIDISEARKILDEDHYGLDKVKRRILEYLAVRKLNPQGKSPILCLVGPPGVGKTSLGRSIARATGREFSRIALGGLHDESEIRGHRRTYIGAMPGKIIEAIQRAGTRNPLFMLDEMDKLGSGYKGDPSSALLEVLDPEQNSTFRDNYLGVNFDLSRVLFIATANMLDSIPRPLLDRMEVIELSSYTQEEKFEIARRYLVRRQIESNGLKPEQVAISDDALNLIISAYTRESGCRNLEREIGAVLRNVAVRIAEGKSDSVNIDTDEVIKILGPLKFESEVALRVSMPGIVTGLAWTPVGGDILFIEAAKVPGNGHLILTGQLGDVMKESAQAALSLVKSKAEKLGIDADIFKNYDVHIHVPAGATPKDGPSAGAAMFTALVSLLTGKTVRQDTAMTGEISLRGIVLPIGGVKEKCIAAARAGITRVLLPKRNQRDLEDIPESARKQLEFFWLEKVEDAIDLALSSDE